jgi:hypothetical protein
MVEQGQQIISADERFAGNRYFNNGDSTQWFKQGGRVTSWDAWYAKIDKNSARVKVKYNDPERSIATYNATLGGTPAQGAFMNMARMLARRVWDPRYTAKAVIAYMQAGFKVHKIPPIVTATNLSSKNQQAARGQIYFIFDKDVSASLSVEDLVITNRKSKKRVAPGLMAFTYDKATNTAVWTFPKLAGGLLPGTDYTVTLDSAHITDVKNTPLDGNYDGIGGDPFTRRLRFRGQLPPTPPVTAA